MLRQRVITALILVALFLYGIFAAPDWLLLSGLLVLIWAAAWEWAQFASIRSPIGRQVYAAAVALFSLQLYALMHVDLNLFAVTIGACALFWLFVAAVVLARPRAVIDRSRYGYALSGFVAIAPFAPLVFYLRDQYGALTLMLALGVVWMTDSSAYFVGKRWGRRKLAPAISPGKSWEGAIGSIGFAFLYLLITAAIVPPGTVAWIASGVAAALISVIGDLYESRAKRVIEIKDSSQLLPGHGGVADRLDGAFAALPMFAAGLMWLG